MDYEIDEELGLYRDHLCGHTAMVNDSVAAIEGRLRDIVLTIAELRKQVSGQGEKVAKITDISGSQLGPSGHRNGGGSEGFQHAGDTLRKHGLNGLDLLREVREIREDLDDLRADQMSCRYAIKFQSNLADYCYVKIAALTLALAGGNLPRVDSRELNCGQWRRHEHGNLRKCLSELLEQSSISEVSDRICGYIRELRTTFAIVGGPPAEFRIHRNDDSATIPSSM